MSRMGIKFSVMPSDIEEATVLTCSEREPEIHAQSCAREKVERVASLISGEKEFWFLGMDTIVVIDDLILGKPKNRDQAPGVFDPSGREWHRVFTGYHIFHRQGSERISTASKAKC